MSPFVLWRESRTERRKRKNHATVTTPDEKPAPEGAGRPPDAADYFFRNGLIAAQIFTLADSKLLIRPSLRNRLA